MIYFVKFITEIEMVRIRYSLILAVLLILLFSGCSDTSSIPLSHRWANVSGSTINERQPGEQFYFNVPVDQALIDSGIPIHIKVSGIVETGALRFELRRPDGAPAWESGRIGPGDYSIQTYHAPEASSTGTYTLGVVWEANTRAVYNLDWTALRIGPAVLIAGVGMVVVALGFTAFAALRGLSWRYLGLGALLWIITVALKFAWAAPTDALVVRALNVVHTNPFAPANIIYYLYIGLLTGIFEVGVTWLVLRYTKLGRASWGQALAFGIGFGAFEALLLGLSSLATSITVLTAPGAVPAYALGQMALLNDPVYSSAPVMERVSVVLAHIFANALIFTAIARRQPGWMWAALLYKTLLDAPAAFANAWGVQTAGRIWTIEAVVMLFGLVGLWGTLQLARRYPPDPAVAQSESTFTAF